MRKKLIEVGLPLEEINKEAAREKSIRHGHPSTLHLWWARRPLAACRAVIFASIVDDPSECPEEFPTEEAQNAERERLHELIRQLVKWETTDETREDSRDIVNAARYEIAKSVARTHETKPPPSNDPAAVMEFLEKDGPEIYDPFAGGGSIPLEAQRLGLRAAASDLNPVPVLINKAMIELAPEHSGEPPVNPEDSSKIDGKRRHGLAEDIRHYGQWMRDRAFERIGRFYPKATLQDGTEATVIAWLWARTVPCSNPACGVHMPLMTSLQVSKKKGNEHWTRPIADSGTKRMRFAVQNHPVGLPETLIGGRTAGKSGAVCVACGTNTKLEHVREQARTGRMGAVMRAVVADGKPGRVYISPNDVHIEAAETAEAPWRPLNRTPTNFKPHRGLSLFSPYNITHWHELFAERQLLALTTFSDLVPEVHEQIIKDGADEERADVILTFLAMAVSKYAGFGSSYTSWISGSDSLRQTFARPAIPMVWDYAEVNPFSSSTGNFMAHVKSAANVVARLPADVNPGWAFQADAATTDYDGSDRGNGDGRGLIIATDPPYYDNINYAELSDFFYIWLRPLLRNIHPDLFGSIQTPKEDEMVAAPRFGDKTKRGERFEDLMQCALERIRKNASAEYPSSIFYAYKQESVERGGRASTGWETFLNAVIKADLEIKGTWPMRTEQAHRLRAIGSNALISSVVLVLQPRLHAERATRNEFRKALKEELPRELARLNDICQLAAVDFRQAAIGLGMSIYSRYGSVKRSVSDRAVEVREALMEINGIISKYHRGTIEGVDRQSQFCLEWLESHGFEKVTYGEAEKSAITWDIDVKGMDGSILESQAGKVRLFSLDEYLTREMSDEMTAWEGCFRMARHLAVDEEAGGLEECARVMRLMRRSGVNLNASERLARALYSYFDSADDSRGAVLFNYLVEEWREIRQQADQTKMSDDAVVQGRLGE